MNHGKGPDTKRAHEVHPEALQSTCHGLPGSRSTNYTRSRPCWQNEHPAPDDHRHRIESADSERLLEWSDRILTAETLDDIFH